MDLQRIQEVMQEIADDMQRDAYGLDGKPFTGKTVAEQFGNNCAAIRAVALAVKRLAEQVAMR